MDKYVNQSITLDSSAQPTLPWVTDNHQIVYATYPIQMTLHTINTPLFKSIVQFDDLDFVETEFRVNPAEPISVQIKTALLVCEDVLHKICDIQSWNNAHHTFLGICSYTMVSTNHLKDYHEAVRKLREEVMEFYETHIVDEDEDDVTE